MEAFWVELVSIGRENRDVVELLEIPGGAILKCLGHGRKGSIPPRVTERAANQGR